MNNSQFSLRLIIFSLLLIFPLISAAHVHVDKTSPQKGAELTKAPTKVDLWFSGKVDGEWSKIKVTDANGNRVDKSNVSNGDSKKHISVDLKPLAAGKYDVKWSAVAGDGHRIKGSLSFTVK